jgi:SAM-dependent methyltransferase
MNKLDEMEDYRNYYQSKESAIEYDQGAYREGSYETLLWDIEKQILIKHIKALRGKSKNLRYLDFACGTGRVISAIEEFVDESHGIDISQSMLNRAAEKTTHSKLLQGDITNDDKIINGKYDIVTTFRFVLNANPDLREVALKILSNNLRSKESWLIFNMHTNKYSYAYISYLKYKIFGQNENQDTKRYMSINDCKKLAKLANLEVVKIRGLGFISSKIFNILPSSISEFIEKLLAKIPLVNMLGTDLIFFCRRKNN